MLVIIDCHYICHAVAFALSQGLVYRGNRTEIIFGFVRQIITLAEKFEPNDIAFCWDSPYNKRMEIFPEYKKKRKTLTQEEEQSRVIKTVQFNQIYDDVLPSLGFRNIYRIRGYESDDLIACIVKGRNPKETIVVSSDHDLFQLLDNCSLYAPTKKQSTDKNIFMREHGIEPSLWHQVKAIAGCNTDEVPGIPSVGEKSAVKYLKGQLKGIKLKDIEAKPEIIKRNLPLVTLPFAGCPVPRLVKNELTIDGFKEVCEKYGMGSLLERDAIRIWERLIRWMS